MDKPYDPGFYWFQPPPDGAETPPPTIVEVVAINGRLKVFRLDEIEVKRIEDVQGTFLEPVQPPKAS
jgi:hypothetical protein